MENLPFFRGKEPGDPVAIIIGALGGVLCLYVTHRFDLAGSLITGTLSGLAVYRTYLAFIQRPRLIKKAIELEKVLWEMEDSWPIVGDLQRAQRFYEHHLITSGKFEKLLNEIIEKVL